MNRLSVLELFCGTKSFTNIAKSRGHDVFTVDNNPKMEPDMVADISTLKITDLPEQFQHPDIVWASPPCQRFSVARVSHNWEVKNGMYIPKNKETACALELLHHTLALIEELGPKYWFIENPRAMMRKMDCMAPFIRRTVTYCQYGHSAQKPTDIWTNCTTWVPRPICKARAPCHESAPRGSRRGTQRFTSAVDKGRVPAQLCLEIIEACEERCQRMQEGD